MSYTRSLNIAGTVPDMWSVWQMDWRDCSNKDQVKDRKSKGKSRWTDDIKRITTNWIQSAQDRRQWAEIRNAISSSRDKKQIEKDDDGDDDKNILLLPNSLKVSAK